MKKNEIITSNSATVVKAPIKTLEQATSQITKFEENARVNLIKIADILGWVDKLKLYETKGYKNVAEYGEAVHGYKRQTTQALVKVASRFLVGTESALKQPDEKDYTVYQLMELLPLEQNEIDTAIQEGELNPYMTTKKIRDLAKAIKKSRDNEEVQEVQEVQEDNQVQMKYLAVIKINSANTDIRDKLNYLKDSILSRVEDENIKHHFEETLSRLFDDVENIQYWTNELNK